MMRYFLVICILLGPSFAFVMDGKVKRSQALNSSTNNRSSDAFLTNQLLQKMKEWNNDMEKTYEAPNIGKNDIGSLLREVVFDGAQRCFHQFLSFGSDDFKIGAQTQERTALDLELRRSNRRSYKSLQQQLLETETDLANLQACLAKEPVGRFD